MSSFFILAENASGYALYQVSGFEEIGSLLPEVQASVKDFKLFSKVVKLKAFHPFTTAENALENIINVSENVVHSDLQAFLVENMPKVKKMKSKGQFLGVQTPTMAGAISELTGISCTTSDLVLEVLRGVRLHLEKFIGSLDGGVSKQARLGLGHGYSRSKVKFNVKKQDNMLIQAICLLDQMDKDLNTNAMRVKEWYSWHFPELQKLLPDSFMFARFVKEVGSREIILTKEDSDLNKVINEITMDEELTNDIIKAAKSSMGFEISELDLAQLQEFSERVVSLGKYRLQLTEYLANKVSVVCPNLGVLIGDSLASRLISHSGSLISLAKSPASTIQILGAEKALFRALKTKGNTPKYGLLFNSGFIGKAKRENKGKISRFLANKCAIAARVDCFTESVTKGLFGEALKTQVEDRLTFLETGEKPPKNADVMSEVVAKVKDANPTSDSDDESMSEVNGDKKKRKRKESISKKDKKKKKQAEENGKKEKKSKKDKKDKKEKKEKKKKKKKQPKE